jgi:hypothetical protein
VLTPVADALAYAHPRGLVHGALEPRCVRIGARGRVWLADLGLQGVIAPPRGVARGGHAGARSAYLPPPRGPCTDGVRTAPARASRFGRRARRCWRLSVRSPTRGAVRGATRPGPQPPAAAGEAVKRLTPPRRVAVSSPSRPRHHSGRSRWLHPTRHPANHPNRSKRSRVDPRDGSSPRVTSSRRGAARLGRAGARRCRARDGGRRPLPSYGFAPAATGSSPLRRVPPSPPRPRWTRSFRPRLLARRPGSSASRRRRAGSGCLRDGRWSGQTSTGGLRCAARVGTERHRTHHVRRRETALDRLGGSRRGAPRRSRFPGHEEIEFGLTVVANRPAWLWRYTRTDGDRTVEGAAAFRDDGSVLRLELPSGPASRSTVSAVLDAFIGRMGGRG